MSDRQTYKETDVLVKINTTLTKEERKYINDNGWYYNDLIRLGIQIKEKTIKDDNQIEKIKKRLAKLEEKYLNLAIKR